MAAIMKNVEEIRSRVILEEFGVKNVSVSSDGTGSLVHCSEPGGADAFRRDVRLAGVSEEERGSACF